MLPWWRIPLYPAAFLSASVLVTWGTEGLPLAMLIRPFLVAIGLSLGLTLLCAALLRDRDRAGLVASSLLLCLIAADDRLAIVLALAAVGVFVEGLVHRSRPAWVAGIATRVMSGVGLVLIIAALIADTQSGAWPDALGDLTAPPRPAPGVPAPGLPDIFVFMLDGYPGDHAAAHATSFDADAFPDMLTDRGFDVDRDSHSNYLLTPLTLATTFSMEHLQDIPSLAAPYGSRASDWQRLRAALAAAPAFAILREKGYEIVSIDGGYAHVRIDKVDRFIEQPTPSELELALINNTRLKSVIETVAPGTLAEVARHRIEDAFTAAERVASEPHDRPRLVFAHVPAPHPPWVFDADGKPRDPPTVSVVGEYSLTDQGALDAGFAQATYIAKRATRAVDHVIGASNGSAVVVVMSDHGPMAGFSLASPLSSDLEIRSSNFMAALTPGHPGLIGDHMTPVNLFPTLFDAYLDVHVDRQPDSIWAWRQSYIDAVEVSPVQGRAR